LTNNQHGKPFQHFRSLTPRAQKTASSLEHPKLRKDPSNPTQALEPQLTKNLKSLNNPRATNATTKQPQSNSCVCSPTIQPNGTLEPTKNLEPKNNTAARKLFLKTKNKTRKIIEKNESALKWVWNCKPRAPAQASWAITNAQSSTNLTVFWAEFLVITLQRKSVITLQIFL
jgi:hypothetical protein